MSEPEPIQLLREALTDPARRETFVQLVLGDVASSGEEPPCRKIAVRPAAGQGGDQMQVRWFAAEGHITKNLPATEAAKVLSRPFRAAHLQTTVGDVHVRITKKGRVLVSTGRPSVTRPVRARPHDRVKRHTWPADHPHPLLQALGIQTRAGQLRSARRGKFHQINQFLDVLASIPAIADAKRDLRIVDCGCGAAYLTFAAHQYLLGLRGREPDTIGIDTRAALIAKCDELRDRLGYRRLAFLRSRIAAYAPPAAPDVVLSLHACDTATDEAIALGVRWRARVILAAPCCQHELRDQLNNDAMRAILRHGLLRGRLADVVTDAARAAILRRCGYQCEVLEFVSSAHTAKNLLLRAERRSSRALPAAEEDYAALKAAWRIAPALERLLAEADNSPRRPQA